MAEAAYAPAQASGELADAGESDTDACILAGTAEHAGRTGADDACDDGRAGN
jgi:pyruvate-ferredoxin/flavodoxin oxidoreductase